MEYLKVLKEIFIDGERYMYILKGLRFSVGVTLVAAMLGVILGILAALMRISNFHPFKRSNNKNLRVYKQLE